MKIKTKIRLGLIFLLAIIITLAITGSYYINKLADISSATLKNNYETLEYTKNMIQALDESDDAAAHKEFDENLRKQENNITEAGEKEATQDIRNIFKLYQQGKTDSNTEATLRHKILKVQELNMHAIVSKNNDANVATKRVFAYITMLGTLCFLLSFTFVINFPGMIANPVTVLTESIRQIANKNYKERINFSSRDEFGELAEAFNTMARRLDEYESSNLNQLMFEKKRIETIINNMRDAIVGLDENNKILFVNTIAIQLLNLDEKEVIGKYAPDIALHNDLFRTLLKKEETEKLLKIYADGKESYFNKDTFEILSHEKKIGEVLVLRNITKFQELDLAKTNFIATISHELKTPLSAMQMSLKLLDDNRIGSLNEEQKKLLLNIRDDRERLLKITTELLDLTQVESGNIHLNIQPVHPVQIVEQSINAVQFFASQKNIIIEKKMDENLPSIKMDADKTAWVLINFLTNAIRYSAQNSKVTVTVQQKESGIEFSVTDFGKGIEEKYLRKVFDKFFQIPGSSSGGSGMGLAISKEIIEKQGGKIAAESKFGTGSRFSFLLKA